MGKTKNSITIAGNAGMLSGNDMKEYLLPCPFCGVHPIRGNDENTIAIFLHRPSCFFAPPTFEKLFTITVAQFEKWNKRITHNEPDQYPPPIKSEPENSDRGTGG